jgi:hypothetical protein
MVIYHRLIIGVLNDYRVADIGDGSIVIESAPRPIPSGESYASVTVPVTYAAIEADMRPPVTGVPDVYPIAPAPIARCP